MSLFLIIGTLLCVALVSLPFFSYAQVGENFPQQCNLTIDSITTTGIPRTGLERFDGTQRTTFNCLVKTNKPFSPNLQCDIAINGVEIGQSGIAGGACPSDGSNGVIWDESGTEATFTCFLPNEVNIVKGDEVTLVTRQFRGYETCSRSDREPPNDFTDLTINDGAFGVGDDNPEEGTDYLTAQILIAEEIITNLIELFSQPYDDLPNASNSNESNPIRTNNRTGIEVSNSSGRKLVHYYSCDQAYGGVGSSMCSSGCAPTAVTVVLKYFEDIVVPLFQSDGDPLTDNIDVDNPFTTHEYFKQVGWKVDFGGSEWGWKSWLRQYGLTGTDIDLLSSDKVFNVPRAQEFLRNGCLIIGSSSAHVFVIKSVDDDGIVEIVDSATPSSNNGGVVIHHWSTGGRNGWTNVTSYAHPVCPKNNR
jgi:hypothetical protein